MDVLSRGGIWSSALLQLVRRVGSGRGFAACMVVLVLTGCSVGPAMHPDTYTVKPGDTLSEIGNRYHIDWHDIARWNHIQRPYRIHAGEQLTLKPFPTLDYAHMPSGGAGQQAPVASTRNTASSGPPPAGRIHALPPRSLPTVQSEPASSGAAAASVEGSASGGSNNGPSTSNNTTASNRANGSAVASAGTQKTSAAAGVPSKDGWQWPASGTLVRGYDTSDRQRGIEIGGKVGDPVYAASSGTVVYNGIGLKGYGKLIIIKHNAHFLSAYGFNKRSLVKQGESISAGQHIADMGLGPGNKPLLHFEIRRDGEPVNPLKLLPKR